MPESPAEHTDPGARDVRLSAPRRSGMKRKVIAAMALLVIAVAAWSGFWWYAAEALKRSADATLDAPVAADGIKLVCAPRTVGGYPFYLALDCGDAAITAPNLPPVALGHVSAAARVYDPERIVAEFSGPLEIGDPASPLVQAAWSLGRMSLHFDHGLLIQGALSIDEPTVTAPAFAAGPMKATLAELHVRNTPDDAGGTDVALTMSGVKPKAATAPFDLGIIFTVRDGGSALRGGGVAVPAEGLPVDLTRVGLRSGDAALEATGNLRIRPDGRLDGNVDVSLVNPEGLAAAIAAVDPRARGLAAPVVAVVSAFGQPGQTDGKPSRTLKITLDASRVMVGFIPVGRLPPIPIGTAPI